MVNELIGAAAQVLLLSLIPFIVWYVANRKTESFFSWIGLKKPVCGNPAETVLTAVVIALLYMGAVFTLTRKLPEGVTTAGSQFAGEGLRAVPAALCYAFIRTALSEEILFRGFILKQLQNKFGFITGNTVQALLFGLLHGIPFGLITKSVLTFVLLTLLPGLMGWYQGWLNEKQCGGSIVPSWLMHGCVNLITAVFSMF
ncbi:MAG: CPBP family intramembrane metalloprotease [Erysipelotrichaceae bacterium]|nr:CPBP family intramembrane metalloprotease [Erysipelotrichaceae bacterium]